MSMVGERFGKAVKEFRAAQGWSQEQLAGRADLNRSYLGEIERGSAMPSLATVVKLATALGVSPSALVGKIESETQQ